MIKEAIEKIQELSLPIFKEIEGRTFLVGETGLQEVRPSLDRPAELRLSSLDALVKMIKTEALQHNNPPLYITIPNHLQVRCFTQPTSDLRYDRLWLYEATATDVPGWQKREDLPFEEAMIALRTRFADTPDTIYALKLLSEITTGAKITYNDNGVATTVVTKKGVDLQTNEAIRPIVTLKPYRTFQEVDQPASQFLIRINDRGISFVEADGGMWKLNARKTIVAYLNEALADEVATGGAVIAL